MTALWIILGIFAFLFLLLLCPITLTAGYETQLEAKLRFLFFSYRLAPKKEKKPPKKGKAKKQEEGSPAVQESKLKQLIKERGFAGFLRLMKELAQLLTEAVKDFLRHANVKELELRLDVYKRQGADNGGTQEKKLSRKKKYQTFQRLETGCSCFDEMSSVRRV